MTDNEKLIEEAASAIHSVAESGASWFDARMADKAQHRAEARAALAVFEKAHTPTDDERELRRLRDIEKNYDTNFPCDGGCNTNEGPSEECSRHGRSPHDLWDLLDAARRSEPEPQGEPSNAQALEDFLGKLAGDGAYTLDFTSPEALHGHIVSLLKRDIAALRAAGTAGGEHCG